MNQSKSEMDSFYESGIKLLANKFIKELSDENSDLIRMKEGLERTFEFWVNNCIKKDEVQMKEDVWRIVIKRLIKKNG